MPVEARELDESEFLAYVELKAWRLAKKRHLMIEVSTRSCLAPNPACVCCRVYLLFSMPRAAVRVPCFGLLYRPVVELSKATGIAQLGVFFFFFFFSSPFTPTPTPTTHACTFNATFSRTVAALLQSQCNLLFNGGHLML